MGTTVLTPVSPASTASTASPVAVPSSTIGNGKVVIAGVASRHRAESLAARIDTSHGTLSPSRRATSSPAAAITSVSKMIADGGSGPVSRVRVTAAASSPVAFVAW